MVFKGGFRITTKKTEDVKVVKEIQKPGNWEVKYVGPGKVEVGKVRVEKV